MMSENEEVRFWREEARHYAENADYWRAKCEALQADNARLREEIIAILNQRIEDVRACNAQPLVARFMAVDEIDWLDTGYDQMMQYISEVSGLSEGQVRDVYAVIYNLGLIDYDVEKEVVFEQFSDEGSDNEDE